MPSPLIQQLQRSSSISNHAAKEQVAQAVAAKACDGDVIGIGSGSTVYLALLALAERIQHEGIAITVIPSSMEMKLTCAQLGITTTTLLAARPDWGCDGADEVDPAGNMIKGRGGALFQEKLAMHMSPQTFILITASKQVSSLGRKFPIPVEIYPQALPLVEQELHKIGATRITLRLATHKDGPVVTENGHWLLDTTFGQIDAGLEQAIKSIPGVIESGLFWGYEVEVMVGEGNKKIGEMRFETSDDSCRQVLEKAQSAR